MDERLTKVFNKLNIDEKEYSFFNGANIDVEKIEDKVVIKISNNSNLPFETYNNIFNAFTNYFNEETIEFSIEVKEVNYDYLEDYYRYIIDELTKENIVMYGYSTLMSFPNGKPLPKRDNIVLTSKTFETPDNLRIAHSIEEAFDLIRNMDDDRDVFVCGGASIYKQLVDYCDMAYITKINATTEDATAFMVNLDNKPNWIVLETSNTITDDSSGKELSFVTYRRV